MAAQEPSRHLDQHPWAKFPVGSWKTVEVIGETLDDRGSVTNVTHTETRTTLQELGENTYTLRIEVTLQVAGKRFPTQVQVVKHGFHGETPGQTVEVKRQGNGEVSISGRKLAVEQLLVSVSADDYLRVSTIQHASDIPPYQLRRETTITPRDPTGKATTTKVEVVALELPQRVLGELKPAAIVKTVQNHAKGLAVTLEVQCDDVPGGVVSHSASERNETGRVVRRSTLDIVDYSIGAGRIEEPTSVIRRRKYNRARRRGEEIFPAPQR